MARWHEVGDSVREGAAREWARDGTRWERVIEW